MQNVRQHCLKKIFFKICLISSIEHSVLGLGAIRVEKKESCPWKCVVVPKMLKMPEDKFSFSAADTGGLKISACF